MPSENLRRRKCVCIQGLGFVGSAMSIAVAAAKDSFGDRLYDVIGVDLPNSMGMERIDALNRGEFPFSTSDAKLIGALNDAHAARNISATANQERFSEADYIVVDVNFDLVVAERDKKLQLEGFINAIRTLGQYAKPGTLVLIETTVPPGTCDKIVIPTLNAELSKRNLKKGSVLVAHSFERVMPGDHYLDSIINFWRVYAGSTDRATKVCEKFLSTLIDTKQFPLTKMDSMVASETTKVMENAYRAVNIAFIDEWTKYADRLNIDLYKIIEAIRVRPTHANIRVPGVGVGGYCLTKDPLFASVAASQLFGEENIAFPFSELAVKVNEEMPLHTVNRLYDLLAGTMEGKEILICGVGYRQDVGDTRFSPSARLVEQLENMGANVTAYDPHVKYWTELNRKLSDRLPDPLDLDAIIFAVPHKEFMRLDLFTWLEDSRPVILDATNVLSDETRKRYRVQGGIVECIGRGQL